jgi:hypothetical protein
MTAGKSWDNAALISGTDSPIVMSMADLTSFRSIIDLWESRDAMAADVGAGAWAVRKWVKRDNIPSDWWSAVLATDKAREAGVTSDLMTRLAAREIAEARV